MATAEQIYVDPSALARLYIPQDGSREMAAWRFRTKGALPMTHHGRTEIVNAVALAFFRGDVTAQDANAAWQELDEDFAEGHLEQVDILWRSALNRASQLSREHSPNLGTRALDVLHVACALELGLGRFLSFDERQQRLASNVGLRIVRIG